MKTAKEIITKFHSIGDAELSLADTQWLIKNIDDAIRETQQQVSVEPVVKPACETIKIIDSMIEETYAQKLFPDKMFEPKLIRWVKKIKIGILEELKEKILSKSV